MKTQGWGQIWPVGVKIMLVGVEISGLDIKPRLGLNLAAWGQNFGFFLAKPKVEVKPWLGSKVTVWIEKTRLGSNLSGWGRNLWFGLKTKSWGQILLVRAEIYGLARKPKVWIKIFLVGVEISNLA